jgi:CheY-like chemotaxis protein
MSPCNSPEPSTKPAMGAPLPDSPRVLVVDDHRDTADSSRMVLEALGYRVVGVAYDGPSALAAARAEPPDVVLLDLAMPGMDGLTLARALRTLPGMAEAFLVCVSGYGRDEDRNSARAAGCDAHLLKPVEFAELERLLAGRAVDTLRPAAEVRSPPRRGRQAALYEVVAFREHGAVVGYRLQKVTAGPEALYDVDVRTDPWTCDCPDATFCPERPGGCKHVLALKAALAAATKQ